MNGVEQVSETALSRMTEECLAKAKDMTFMGMPVSEMDAANLLLVVGFLASENQRLHEQIRSSNDFSERLSSLKEKWRRARDE